MEPVRRATGSSYEMTVPGLIVLFLFLVSVGALAIFSLALAHVLAGWGIFFFYTVPALAMLGWVWHEASPSTWRRAIRPLFKARRALRGGRRQTREPRERPLEALRPPGRLPLPAGHLPEHLPLAPAPVTVLVEGTIRPWLIVMRAFLAVGRSSRGRAIVAAGFGLAAAGTFALVARHFTSIGWPLEHADLGLVAVSASLFLSGYAFKAFGWRRLFRPHERPSSLTLAAASGAASVTGAALPGRFDDVVRVAVIRRLTGRHPRVGTVVLTLFLVGLLDATALAPFAAAAAATAKGTVWEQVALAVVAAAGGFAAVLIAALPRIAVSKRLGRYRLGRWLSEHAPASPRDARYGTLLVTASWLIRAVGLFALLSALGFGRSFPLAIAYLSAGAASAALPIGPAGAATQAGAGAAVLVAGGIPTEKAVAFAVVAQSLSIVAGAAVVLVTLSLRGLSRLRAGRAPAALPGQDSSGA